VVARQAMGYARYVQFGRHAMVNGAPGMIAISEGQLYSVGGFTVRGGKIVEIDILADPERLRAIDLSALDG
jgi:RNA polymerase sigma-70 factor (ECF subfamily)